MSDVTDSVLAAVRSRFPEIETAVNEAIAKARVTDGDWRSEAINWADLRCAVVEFVVDEHSAFYRAIIEEASPACPSLISFVSGWLRGKGLGGVEVVTEW